MSEGESVCLREREREGGGQRGEGERESVEQIVPPFLFFPRMHIHLAGHVTWWLPLSVLFFRGSPQSMLSQFKL